MMDKSMISKTLKILRKYHNLSQTKLAIELGISNSHLSELESGKKSISIDILFKYVDFFKIKLSLIFLLSESMDNENVASVIKDKKILKIIDWIKEWKIL